VPRGRVAGRPGAVLTCGREPAPPFPDAPADPELAERLRDLPKVELHQHVDGSIPAR